MLYIEIFLLSISFIILSLYLALEFFHGPKQDALPFALGVKLPKVSILKPISNIDDGMEENIETFFNLDYPDYEIIFGMDTDDNKCVELVEKARNAHPVINSKIVFSSPEKTYNPKILNLMNMQGHCSGELFWLTDSNVRVHKGTLNRLVHEYVENDSKIVFSPILGTGSRTPGSIMENAYLNMFVSANIIAGWKLVGEQIIVGKSMLVEKMTLDKFGGFGHFKEYLAEDFIMGRIYKQNGYHVSTNCTWVTNYISGASIAKFWQRVVRWSTIRYNTERFFYFFEIILNPIMISLLFAFFLGSKGAALLILTVILKVLFEYTNLFMLNRQDALKPQVLLLYPFWMVLKDILLFLIYLSPFFSNEVHWRGRKIKIDDLGKIVEIK